MTFFEFLDQQTQPQAPSRVKKREPGAPVPAMEGLPETEPEQPTPEVAALGVARQALDRTIEGLKQSTREIGVRNALILDARSAQDVLGRIRSNVIRESKPEDYASGLMRELKPYIMDRGKLEVHLGPLDEAVIAYRKMLLARPPTVEDPNVKAARVAGIEEQERSWLKQQEELSERFKLSPREEVATNLSYQLSAVNERLKELAAEKARVLTVPSAPVSEAQPPVSAQRLPSPANTPEAIPRAWGMDTRQFYSAVMDTAMRLGINPSDSVRFDVAVRRLLQMPEIQRMGVVDRFAGLERELLGPIREQQEEIQGQIRRERDIRLQRMKELNNTRDIQNWYSAIIFVLISALVGPRVAIAVFSRARERGELALMVKQSEEGIADLQRKLVAEQREANAIRREVARAKVGQVEFEEQESIRRFSRAQRDWALAMQKAKSDVERNYLQGLKDRINHQETVARLNEISNPEVAKDAAEAVEDLAQEFEEIVSGKRRIGEPLRK